MFGASAHTIDRSITAIRVPQRKPAFLAPAHYGTTSHHNGQTVCTDAPSHAAYEHRFK
jgi:hypothetical protein